MGFVKLKQSKLYEEIVNQIKGLIENGQIIAGDKLPTEKELAELFGVSRSAVREAISALAVAGIVEVRHGSGIYLTDTPNNSFIQTLGVMLVSNKDNLLDILELRKGLEAEAAYLAARRATDDDILHLENEFSKLVEEVTKGSLAVEEDFRFHYAIAEATRNSTYISVFNTISEISRDALRASRRYSQSIPGLPEVVLEEHRKILNCIKDGDAEGARAAMRYHIQQVEKKLGKEED